MLACVMPFFLDQLKYDDSFFKEPSMIFLRKLTFQTGSPNYLRKLNLIAVQGTHESSAKM